MVEGVDAATGFIPDDTRCAKAIQDAKSLSGDPQGGDKIRAAYPDMSPVHTVNNLGLVAWALLRHADEFDAAIGDVVAAGLDTDCNGATVGALWALQNKPLPPHWLEPWRGRVGVSLAGIAELNLEELVSRTVAVAEQLDG